MAVFGELPNVVVPTIRKPCMSLDFCLPVLYNGMNDENLLSVDVAQLQGQLDESPNWTVVAKMDCVYEANRFCTAVPQITTTDASPLLHQAVAFPVP